MADFDHIIKAHENIINRFIDLAMGEDYINDARHKWFYTIISWERINTIKHLISREEIKQELYICIFNYIKERDNPSDEHLNWYFGQAFGWALKNYLVDNIETRNKRFVIAQETYPLFIESQDTDRPFDVRWLLSKDDNNLNPLEKYVLYLWLYKCYSTRQIINIIYQDRMTLFKIIKSATTKLRSVNAKDSESRTV